MNANSRKSFPGYAYVKVTWKLKNFEAQYFQNPNFVFFQSPMFRVPLSNYYVTKFKLIAMRNRNTLNIILRKDPEDRSYESYQSLVMHYNLQIKDFYLSEYLPRAEGQIEKLYFEQKLGKVLTSKDLHRPLPHIIKDKTVEIVLFLRVIENKKNPLVTSPSTVLSQQFEQMFNSQTYSDFTLVTSEDEEIFVHKNVLSIRSPVFEAMVNTKLQEGAEKRAKIDDIQARSLIELVRFIYSGRVNEIDSIASELLYAAGKYDLQDLKPLCVKSLAVNLNNENALGTFILADLHEERELKEFAMGFIKFNYSSLKSSEQFKDLTQAQMKIMMDFFMEPSLESANVSLVTTITVQPRLQPTPTANPAR